MKSPKELHEELKNTKSVTIGNSIHIVKRYGSYRVEHINSENGDRKRIVKKYKQPTVEEIQVYIDAVETVSEWSDSGYSDVGNWSYMSIKSNYDWRTESDNYVRLLTRGDKTSVTASKSNQLFIRSELLSGSTESERSELAIAIILHSISPRMFDYLHDKYQSMYENLCEIRGIGNKVATQLLGEKDCTTYSEAERKLYDTNIPKQYIPTAREELREKQKQDSDPLTDPAVKQEYSTLLMANKI